MKNFPSENLLEKNDCKVFRNQIDWKSQPAFRRKCEFKYHYDSCFCYFCYFSKQQDSDAGIKIASFTIESSSESMKTSFATVIQEVKTVATEK